MCGIFGYVGRGNATQIVFDGLKKLEYRGYDSWGIVAVSEYGLKVEKHIGKIGANRCILEPSRVALGHTRWATHGGVTTANSHPHLDCHGELAVAHNGIIENYQELKSELMALGHHFVSETDTEVFAHLVEEAHKKLTLHQAVTRSFKRLKGLNTVAVLASDSTLIACRNGSPLVVGLGTNGQIYLSSDMPSLLELTKKVAVIEDHQAVVVRGGILQTPLKFHLIKLTAEVVDRGKYPHFLLKEIHDQPVALRRLATSDQAGIRKARRILDRASSIYALGCGTAFYAMIELSYLFARDGKCQIAPISANEFPSFAHLCNKSSVVILASQSGETIDTVQALRLAKGKGATTIALVNVPGSTLEREADLTLPLLAGIERSVVSTKAFTNMVAASALLFHGSDPILSVAKGIEQMLSGALERAVTHLATRLKTHRDIYLVGRGESYPVVLEGAMKLKEATYTHAEGFAGGELKHGVIALIEKGTPCIVVVADDAEKDSTLSGAMELKVRGAWIIGVSPTREAVFDDWLPVENDPTLAALYSVIPLQLLGYYLAVAKGLDPDMPRNLAKSVTVK
jgi:glucosamine--fructose-6-phosphate aminotransferase (isomerizing)